MRVFLTSVKYTTYLAGSFDLLYYLRVSRICVSCHSKDAAMTHDVTNVDCPANEGRLVISYN